MWAFQVKLMNSELNPCANWCFDVPHTFNIRGVHVRIIRRVQMSNVLRNVKLNWYIYFCKSIDIILQIFMNIHKRSSIHTLVNRPPHPWILHSRRKPFPATVESDRKWTIIISLVEMIFLGDGISVPQSLSPNLAFSWKRERALHKVVQALHEANRSF